MKRNVWIAIFLLHICLALCPLAVSGKDQRNVSVSYDGHWWLLAPNNEQYGFLNGFFDCYFYEYRGSAHFSYSVDVYQLDITKYFQGNVSDLNEPILRVLLQFHDPRGFKIIDPYAEPANGQRGGKDGLYWMQISANSGPQLEQRGFIEGYLECHVRLNHNKGGAFSRPPAEYVSLITQWYGFKRDTDDVDLVRQPTAIANVLFKFQDK
ncbi:MAG: hypothetical protein ACRETA_05810 [Gammaproteobacteria bacterium]